MSTLHNEMILENCFDEAWESFRVHNKLTVDEMTELAARASGKTILISTDTEEGATLYRGFGGIAAMLRYPMS